MATTDATCLDIIKRGMRMAGILGAGENPDAEDQQDVFDILNGMLDAWDVDALRIYNVNFTSYALTSGQQSYTIGQSGSANFNGRRPDMIVNANLVFTSTTPNTRRPLYVLDDDEWAAISVRSGLSPSAPTQMYYSPDFPDGTLNFWPTPGSGYSVELETWVAISQFAAITDTFSFPPGYYEAICSNLAMRLCTPEWGMLSVPDSIDRLARESRARIEAHNSTPSPLAIPDSGLQGNRQHGGRPFNIKNPAPQWYR
jgi:hypothetical protein